MPARLAEALFASGYRFFLPYLALYLLAWGVDLPVEAVVSAFVVLHGLNLALFAVFLHGRRQAFRTGEAIFWGALLLFLLLPGAYLEFPADAWEHLRRIAHWSRVDTIAGHDTATWKFAYLWGYSWLHWIPPAERRIALDLYSAFWQLLVGFQLYALARRLGFAGGFAKLQVVAFFLLFGQGPKGIRFLALSSTPLAYVAFLAALVCCIDSLDGRDRKAWRRIPALLLLALANHRQEVMFIGMGLLSLLLVAWAQSAGAAQRRRALQVGLVLATLSLAGGALAWAHFPALYPEAFHYQVSALGGFRLWQRWYFLDTWGVHGVVSVVCAIALLRTQPRLAVLSLMPALLLSLPPSALFLMNAFPGYMIPEVVHRLLLGFPTSFALVAGLRALAGGSLLRPAAVESRRRTLVVAALGVLAFALPPHYPWHGRLFLAVHRPHPDLELRFLDETVDWFARHRDLRPDCRILSDGATQYGLLAQLGFPVTRIATQRRTPPRLATTLRTTDALLGAIREWPTCGVLVSIADEVAPLRASAVSPGLHRAWDSRFASPAWLTSDGFRKAAEGLRAHGWQRSRVPPWYFLYEPPSIARRNLILISIDTLRADMLGSYGYDRATSPTLDALAAQGALFESAMSPAPWTMPAHASLLTGLYPKRHGMKSHDYVLGPETPTLAEMLAEQGFATAAIVNSHILAQRFGMHRGFQQHSYLQEAERRRKPTDVPRLALEWLERRPPERFFLFLHFYDLHSDYRSLPRYESRFLRPYAGGVDGTTHQLRRFRAGDLELDADDARNLEDRYAAGIRQLDDGLARLIEAFRRAGALDDSLLVVTSDHGEEFLSHGGVMHGRTQYDEVLRVPLMLVGPGIPAGLRLPESVSLIDLAPTLLSLLELPPAPDLDGLDLSPLLRGETLPELADRRLFGEADWGNALRDMTRSIRHGDYKGILDRSSGEIDLYDLAADPAEQHPITRPALAERLRAEIEAFTADEVAPDPSRALEALDPEDVERLKALGYL